MPEPNNTKQDGTSDEVRRRVAAATERAKFKNWRLRRLKERNELYLMSRREDDIDELDSDDEVTKEL
jgi:hypothetical protein